VADPAGTEFRHVRFADVLERGPSLAARVAGSPQLRRRQALTARICRLLGRVQLAGLELVPDTGPAILAVNHTSLMDGPLLFGLLDRPVTFLVKAEAFELAAGLAGRLLVAGGQLPVRRYRIDPGPVRYGLALLRAGGILGMFPEGSRGVGLAGSVRPGVGYFAVKTGAPVLPVAVLGSGRTVRTLGRPPVRIRFGEPLTFPAAGPVVNRGRWLAAAESVRLALAELVAETAADLVTDRGRPQPTMEA
jgi:1-acyl-sn-glycerol-3-phosphate acyltransferase